MRRALTVAVSTVSLLFFATAVVAAGPGIGGVTFEEEGRTVTDTVRVNETGERRAYSVSGLLHSTYPWVETVNRSISFRLVEFVTNDYGHVINFTFGDVSGELWDNNNETVDSDVFAWEETVAAGETSNLFALGFDAENTGELGWIRLKVPVTVFREDRGEDTYTDTLLIPLEQYVTVQTVEHVVTTPHPTVRGGEVTVNASLSLWKTNGSVTVQGDTHRITGKGWFTFSTTIPRDVEGDVFHGAVNASTGLRDRLPVRFTVRVEDEAPTVENLTLPGNVQVGEQFNIRITAENSEGWDATAHLGNVSVPMNRAADGFHAVATVSTTGVVPVTVILADGTGNQVRSSEHTLTVAAAENRDGESRGETSENSETETGETLPSIAQLRGSQTVQAGLAVLAAAIVTGFYLYFSTGTGEPVTGSRGQEEEHGDGAGYFAEQQQLTDDRGNEAETDNGS